MTDLTLAQQQAMALAKARRLRAAAPSYDAQGFPVQPQGGSSTNSPAVADLGQGLNAALAGAANGASLGFADEGLGLAGGISSMVQGNGYLPGYQAARDDVRAGMGQARTANPMEFGAGGIAGSLVPAIAAAPYATGASLLGTSARGAALGALEGGLAGAGNADGEGIIPSAGRGALIGGAIGGLAPAAVALAKAGLIDVPVAGVDAIIGRANQGKAARAVGGALRSSGKTRQDIASALAAASSEGQPMYGVMDALGTAGQRQASGIARAGGDAGTEIADFLSKRQAGQGDRVGSFVEDAFGFRGRPTPQPGTNIIPQGYKFTENSAQVLAKPQRSAADLTNNLTIARSNSADVAYDASRSNAAPVNLNDAIATIDNLTKRDPILGDSALADTVIGKRLKALRAQMTNGKQQLIDFDSVLNIKQDMFSTMEGLRKAGKTVPKELSDVYGALDSALETSSDMYRIANDQFRSASKVIGAVDEGAMMANRGRAADNVPAFQAMNPDMQGSARVGYGDTLLNALERNQSPTANKAKPLIQSQKRAAEAEAMALQPDLYARRLGRESDMWETQNRALGGSRTADNQQDIAGLAGGALGAARSAASMNLGDAVSKIAGLLAPIAKIQTPATRQLIARALMSNDMGILTPLIKREAIGKGASRVIEALVRNGAQIMGGTR